MAAPTKGKPVDSRPAQTAVPTRHLHVQVESTSEPEPEQGSDGRTYTCEANINVSEGVHTRLFRTRLVILNPEGWEGMAASFDYNIDSREYPTFEKRADLAREWALKEFPPGELLCVVLLGVRDRSDD